MKLQTFMLVLPFQTVLKLIDLSESTVRGKTVSYEDIFKLSHNKGIEKPKCATSVLINLMASQKFC